MRKAIQQFEVNLNSAKELRVIYLALIHKVTQAICLDELLRAELVLAVSAFDCYIHDLVRIGMGAVFNGGKAQPSAYRKFTVSLDFVKRLLPAASRVDALRLFDEEIRRLHAFRTFQTADSVSQALSLIGIKGVWEKVGRELSRDSTHVRMDLNLIIDRRNRIAHESDVDPSLGIGEKYPIDRELVDDAVGFIDCVAHAIQRMAETEVVF